MLKDADLIAKLGHLHHVLEAPGDLLSADEAIVEAFGPLLERYGCDGPVLSPLRATERLSPGPSNMMNDRHDENVGLEELASLCNLTSFQLIGLFKRRVGLTPHAYLIHIRLKAACSHLKRGCTVAQSALAAGFCDQSALTKHFKRRFGITPLQFAQAAR